MIDWLKGVSSFHFTRKNGQLDFHVGWLWIVLLIALIWWGFS